MIVDMSHWFIEDYTNVYDIGTSTGETINNLYEKHLNKNVQYIGIDSSKEMTEKARQRLSDKNNVTIINSDVTDSNYTITNASFITSVLTVMFIPQRKRQDLLNKIYNGLNVGSAFVMIEKIVGNNARFDEMWIELYHDMKLRNGLQQDEVIAKSRSIRGVLRPNTVEENIKMLTSAGFNDIDMFFKWNNFAGFIAIK